MPLEFLEIVQVLCDARGQELVGIRKVKESNAVSYIFRVTAYTTNNGVERPIKKSADRTLAASVLASHYQPLMQKCKVIPVDNDCVSISYVPKDDEELQKILDYASRNFTNFY